MVACVAMGSAHAWGWASLVWPAGATISIEARASSPLTMARIETSEPGVYQREDDTAPGIGDTGSMSPDYDRPSMQIVDRGREIIVLLRPMTRIGPLTAALALVLGSGPALA